MDDYILVEELWEQRDPKSFHCPANESVDTSGEGGGGGIRDTDGFGTVQRVEVEWWFLLLTSREEEAE